MSSSHLFEMSCFNCFFGKKSEDDDSPSSSPRKSTELETRPEIPKQQKSPEIQTNPEVASGNIKAQTFTFRELAAATKNFRPESLLGEGGFGRVYKGCLENTNQIVAVKQLDRNGVQGHKEFLTEVLMLSLLHHENLANLVGYCADGDQRLLVYEHMPLGSLEKHLFDTTSGTKPLSWHLRMKIAFGAAQGLEYLHEKAKPPVIYRDLKPSNILLDKDFNPRLSDFGLAKLGPVGDRVSSRVMGTYGYCAPEYARNGELTLKSDVYSFGVVLLELITGRRAIDPSKPMNEQNLVTWAQPMFRDQMMFPKLVDPRLEGDFYLKALNQLIGMAAMCLQDEPSVRPLMADVVMTLSFLASVPEEMSNPVSSHTQLPQAAPAGSSVSARNSSSSSSFSKYSAESDADQLPAVAEASMRNSSSSWSSGSRHGSDSL